MAEDEKDKKQDSVETPELEHKVDVMMDPKLPDSPDSGETAQGAPPLPEIDIFKDDAAAADGAADAKSDVTAEPSAKAPKPTEKIAMNPEMESPAADPLVDDIVAHEGDALLAADDARIAKAFMAEPPRRGGLGAFFRAWWGSKPARYITLILIAAGLVAAGVTPASRYYVLNTAGVRVSSTLTVLDDTNNLPLKNVAVSVQDQSVKTNDDGVAHLSGLKLGTSMFTISRRGFAPAHQVAVLGLGSNPLSDVSLRAVGTQFKFALTDYLSGKPVTNAEVSQGDAAAQTDEHGVAVLTIGANDNPNFDALVTAAGYRSEKVAVTANSPATIPVSMVNSKQTVYVSKQDGKYDLYRSDLDGKNKQVLLSATGNENEQISLVLNSDTTRAALVSRRDNLQDQDGYMLQTLTIVTVSNGSVLTLDHSEQIQLVGWDGSRLVYVKIKAGTSAGNPERYQLFSYDVDTTAKLLLASANYFSDIVMAKGSIYYAASNNYQGGQSQFARIDADNTGKQVILSQDIFNILRKSYDTMYVSANPSPNWYQYKIGDDSATRLSSQPADADSARFYLDAPDGKHALWTDVRDGKGVLLEYDANTKKDTTLVTAPGLTYPLRWVDARTVMYRIETPQESADYVLSLDGGASKKVADVTNTAGLGKWFYY